MVNKSLSKSLLTSVQTAYKALENNSFNENLMEQEGAMFEPIVEFFNIKPEEAIILGFFINQTINDVDIDRECFTRTFSKDISSLPDVLEIVDQLAEKKLIFKGGDDSKKSAFTFKFIKVHPRVMKAVINGDIELMQLTPCETLMEFLDDINDVVVQRMEKHITSDQLIKEVELLMEVNKQLDSVQWIRKQDQLNGMNLCIFLNMCIEHARGQEEVDCEKVIRQVCDSGTERMRHKNLLKSGNHTLIKKEYVEFCGSFFALFETVKLTDDVMKNIFGGSPESTKKEFKPRTCHLIDFEKINNESLFYNSKERQSVLTLNELLTDNKYKQITEKMKSSNMRPGFTILMYGSPGTGKTSTAKQIAKTTGRNILTVDIPSIQSKWLGDSEKNMARIFDEYEQSKSKFTAMPILLFNEADALLGKRVNNNSSIDQINNSLQNVLLQKLEDLEGIFIATTNLIHNLDKAFDRRFLYKIEFCKPEADVRMDILKSSFPNIPIETLDKVNQNFELTGGQISNISKKLLVNQLLSFESNAAEQLFELCEEEVRMRKPTHVNPIGFKTQQ